MTCYEAGRDGFWLHRFPVARGAESYVVDPGSLLVNRRARRAKSDRLDVESLLRLMIRHDVGDCSLGRMVVALWRYLTTGLLPQGARLKST